MTTQLTLAEEAYSATLRGVGRIERMGHVKQLGDTGLFSKRQIAEIAGVPLHDVLQVVDKSSKSGGNVNPESLPVLVRAAGAEDPAEERALIHEAYELGTSANTIAMLLDMKVSQVWHRIRRHKRELEEGLS